MQRPDAPGHRLDEYAAELFGPIRPGERRQREHIERADHPFRFARRQRAGERQPVGEAVRRSQPLQIFAFGAVAGEDAVHVRQGGQRLDEDIQTLFGNEPADATRNGSSEAVLRPDRGTFAGRQRRDAGRERHDRVRFEEAAPAQRLRGVFGHRDRARRGGENVTLQRFERRRITFEDILDPEQHETGPARARVPGSLRYHEPGRILVDVNAVLRPSRATKSPSDPPSQ